MSGRILIAEDSEPLAASLAALLRERGYAVDLAGDGVTALRQLAATPYDLLLLDLKLPGLHGIELLKKLRQSPRTVQLPVVVMSGVYKGERYVAAARAHEVVAYLEKPFRAAQLLAAVLAALPPATATATVAAAAPATPEPPVPEPAPAAAPAADPLPFERHLARAFTGRFSGSILLAAEDGVRELVCCDGLPLALRPGFADADLGRFLQRQGLIDAAEYRYFATTGAGRSEVLVQLGCLSYAELLPQQLAWLTAELVAGCARPPLAATFEPQPLPAVAPVSVNLPQTLLQGFRARHTPERGRRLLEQGGGRYVALAPAYHQYGNFLSLDLVERQLLARLDGSRTLREVLQDDGALAPLVLTLQLLGMVRFGAAPLSAAPVPARPQRADFNALAEEGESEVALLLPGEELERFADLVEGAGEGEAVAAAVPPDIPARGAGDLSAKVRQTLDGLRGKNHYEVFGLTQGNFSFERLKERYFAVTREFGPDVLMQLGGAEAGMVEEILSTVATAYNTLSDVVKKESYDELLGADRVGLGQQGDERFQAQVQSQSGKVFIEMEEWDNAERALQDAVNIEPENGDYLAHLAWTIYRNPKYANSRAMRDKARQMLNRALTLEKSAAGFAFKGWLQLDAGQDVFAEGEFNKALKLDARNQLARKGLRQLQEKKEQQKKGLFGLFR